MNSKFAAAALVAAFLLPSVAGAKKAHAATTTLSIIINSPPSTTVTCTLPTTPLLAPLAAGATVCPIVIAPAGWSGLLALSGANASAFALSGTNLVVGTAALNVGSYSVTITATP